MACGMTRASALSTPRAAVSHRIRSLLRWIPPRPPFIGTEPPRLPEKRCASGLSLWHIRLVHPAYRIAAALSMNAKPCRRTDGGRVSRLSTIPMRPWRWHRAASIIDPNTHAVCNSSHHRHPHASMPIGCQRQTDTRDWYARLPSAMIPQRPYFVPKSFEATNALALHLQGRAREREMLAKLYAVIAKTWGCEIGELFDYCPTGLRPLQCFCPGELRPSGRGYSVIVRFSPARSMLLGARSDLLATKPKAAAPSPNNTCRDRAVIDGVKKHPR